MTYKATALLYSTPGTGFGDTTNANEEHSERQTITSGDIELRFKAVKRKIADAKKTLGAVTFPHRHDILTSPTLLCSTGKQFTAYGSTPRTMRAPSAHRHTPPR